MTLKYDNFGRAIEIFIGSKPLNPPPPISDYCCFSIYFLKLARSGLNLSIYL